LIDEFSGKTGTNITKRDSTNKMTRMRFSSFGLSIKPKIMQVKAPYRLVNLTYSQFMASPLGRSKYKIGIMKIFIVMSIRKVVLTTVINLFMIYI
jgi:hypothetical protein